MVKLDERLSVDYLNNSLLVQGEEVLLTPIESRLLHALMKHRGRVVDSQALLLRVWFSKTVYEGTLTVHLHRLRKKIEVDPRNPEVIVTQWSGGYAFQAGS